MRANSGSRAANLVVRDGEQPDTDIRELEFKKNQYGPTGESIVLRYQRGLFLPEAGLSSLDKLARESRAADVFLALLGRYELDGRNVSDLIAKFRTDSRLSGERS